jgi:hypothetical protein
MKKEKIPVEPFGREMFLSGHKCALKSITQCALRGMPLRSSLSTLRRVEKQLRKDWKIER